MRILAVGSIAFDNIETPFDKREGLIGGSAIYFSLAASNFTGIDLVGVVGRDFPVDFLISLNNRGVDTEGVKVMEGKTFTWSGIYLEDMNKRESQCTELNVFASFDPEIPGNYRKDRIVFLANIDPDLQERVISSVEKPELIATDTMNFWIKGKPRTLRRVLEKSHILIVNEEEVKLLSEERNLLKAIDRVFDMGPSTVIVKRGEYGALISQKNWICQTPALPLRDVRDPTGAGDTFAGGFMGYLASGGGMERKRLTMAMLYGTALASMCVERFGVERLLSCDRREIDRRVDELLSTIVRFEKRGEGEP